MIHMADSPTKKRSVLGRVTNAALGAAFTVGDVIDDSMSTAAGMAKGALHVADVVTAPVRKPLDAMGVTDLVTGPVEALAETVETSVDRLVERGRTGLVDGGTLAAESIASVVDAVLIYLSDNPQVDALIRTQIDKIMPVLAASPAVEGLIRAQVAKLLPDLANSAEVQQLIRVQAGHYLAYLNANPAELEQLIRAQGDEYIEYLNAYPAAVQNLVQGQSLSMAGQLRDEVRERTVTADSLVDVIVRHLFRRKAPSEIPSPSPDIIQRAEYGRLPSDYMQERKNGHS